MFGQLFFFSLHNFHQSIMGGCCSSFPRTVYLDHFRCFKYLVKKGRVPDGFSYYLIINHDKIDYLRFAHENGHSPGKTYLHLLHDNCLIYSLKNNIPMYLSEEKKFLPFQIRLLLVKYLTKDPTQLVIDYTMTR